MRIERVLFLDFLYVKKREKHYFVESKESVVNFGSGAALSGQEQQASYAAAKEAIRGLSRVAANEWGKDEIRVNIVCPLALTEGVAKWKESNSEQYKQVAGQIPLNHFGDPQKDMAPVVAFLLSLRQSKYDWANIDGRRGRYQIEIKTAQNCLSTKTKQLYVRKGSNKIVLRTQSVKI
jgi:NAD(P)-dependent dehydrogenase (short-subunit alcohol dehydrogenase family)